MIILATGLALGALAVVGALWFLLEAIETYARYAMEVKNRLWTEFRRPLSAKMEEKLHDLYKAGASVDKAIDRLMPGPSREEEVDRLEPVERHPLTRV
jgi:hypothetical protein